MKLFFKPVLRWPLGAVLAPTVAYLVDSLMPAGGGEATIAGMTNIAYLLLFIRHLFLFSLFYGVAFPFLFPQSSTRPAISLSAGGVIGTVLLLFLFPDLNMGRPGGPAPLATMAWHDSILATVVSLLVCFIVGFWNNEALQNARYWRRLFKVDGGAQDETKRT